MSLLESLRERRSPWLLPAAVAVAAVVLVGSIAWYTLRAAPPLFSTQTSQGGAFGDAAAGDGKGADSGGQPEPPPPVTIYVHVAGAVLAPGVYGLTEGQRVVDAIAVAGGGAKDAAINSINLAETLVDGQRLYVPTQREAQGTKPGGTFTGGKPFTPPASAGTAGSGSAGPVIIDLNTATKDDLDRIPGIGPVIAERIILYRTANGPFKSVDDLTKVSGIGDKKLQDLKPYLTIK